jgi:hypothetical protein
MATRAEMFKYFEERSGPKKPARVERDWPGAAHLPGVHPSDDRLRHGTTASRNWSAHAAREAVYVLEDSPSGKPSKKSTRKSANRMKPGRR